MTFKTQVRVKEYNAGEMIHVWKDICPSGGEAYVYPTADEAWLACQHANDGSQTRDDYRVIDIERNVEVK